MMYAIIILILIFYILYLNWNNTICENFTLPNITKTISVAPGQVNTPSLLDDSLFANVITYTNDDDPYSPDGKTSIDKCLDNCNGKCIEFGPGSASFCFPPLTTKEL